ncbi:MAG: transcription-repair coupling factor [Clostridiales bacterium]|nr:transcription-repair coupling factor [Clostridiales bacterium]
MNSPVRHAGLEGVQAAPIAARLVIEAGEGAKALIVTAGAGSAASFAKTLGFFLDGVAEVCVLPEDDPPFLHAEARSRETEAARLNAMTALTSPGAAVVVCPVSAAIRDVCSPEAFAGARLELAVGMELPRDGFIRGLAGLGYRRAPYTESPGEFSARGDVVDVFPVNREEPLRVSFFDTLVENVRSFDPETQKSRGGGLQPEGRQCGALDFGVGRPTTVVIAPAAEPAGEGLSLVDWVGEGGVFACIDPVRVGRALELREMEALQDFEAMMDEGEEADWGAFRGGDYWRECLGRHRPHMFEPYGEAMTAGVLTLQGVGESCEGYETVAYEAKYAAALYGQLDLLAAELKRYLRDKFTITIIASTEARLVSLREFAEQEGLADRIFFAVGELAAGFEISSEKRVWLWDGDIFKSGKKSRRTRVKGHEKISAFTDIEKGDYIVHENHGIGVYRGIKTIEADGGERDYLTIAYSGKDVLYLPVEQMDRVQKYVGGGEKRPRVSKLGSGDWERTKARVRAEIEEYAGELTRLAAERKLATGFAFSPDTVWLKDFEDRFPFEPTPDQVRCFETVRGDMENPWPMDRLICGDVGYGKTEVALRAVFKCVQDGKQAAILVPTTILASQHFRTFSERFSDFPVEVEMLSRFQSAGEQRKIAKGLADGGVDIVIGTHALLSSKIVFKDLGLLIIDEEQRFGVKQKEKIRGLRAGVDILTLTATPIPRTLNMSLLGIKDMDLIEDPPEDRYPVRTFVSEERADVISESVRRELDRGGQVYVVYNRVSGIERVAEQIRALAPQARLGVCHAKMNERMIEEVMHDFYEGEYDVLLSTTIIESGLDIPNVNTIVILDADRLGLTQLYQLRGRVGRTNRIAFAYLMYRRDKVLTENAEKRLRTIREFTEFGSGFKVAMKDLEIRGAGNLLGVSQHGHMASVGYEMYCKLIDEAVTRLAGRAPVHKDIENECRVELFASAVIPPGYIEDEIVKLQAYKRISFVDSEQSKTAVLDELGDRFGPVPSSVLTLIHAAWMRHLGERAGLSEIKLKPKLAEMVYREAPANLMERVFLASDKAHSEGAALEADMKATPKLVLKFPHGVSGDGVVQIALDVLNVLSCAS